MQDKSAAIFTNNPPCKLIKLGQSIWLDDLGRSLLASGKLSALMHDDGVTGLTSNPAIFEKAINGSTDYDEDIARKARNGSAPAAILRELMVGDIQQAADILRPAYERSHGTDGFVSLEVSPLLAHDAEATLVEARELWHELDRANVMIKIPATRAGLIVIRRLAALGVNVNVTLLFGLGRYQEVCEAWLAGLEDRVKAGESVKGVVSVASFFLSRIDSKIDPLLMKGRGGQAALERTGRVAIASAKLAYQHFQRLCGSQRCAALASEGAQPQRLLWASTGTKDPALPDVHYVEQLIGKDTVTTLPTATLAAYRDHGNPVPWLEQNVAEARALLDELPTFGINFEALLAELEEEGLRKFIEPHAALLASLQKKCEDMVGSKKS